MINYKEFKGKRIKIILKNDEVFLGELVYIMKPEDEEEEEMIFIDDNLAIKTSEIKKIEILNEKHTS